MVTEDQKKTLLQGVNEFLESAQNEEEAGRMKSAITLYFKAMVECIDFLIYKQILNVPHNHRQRFRHLKKFFPEMYDRFEIAFKIYRRTYSQKVLKEDLEAVKNGAYFVIEKAKVSRYLKKSVSKA